MTKKYRLEFLDHSIEFDSPSAAADAAEQLALLERDSVELTWAGKKGEYRIHMLATGQMASSVTARTLKAFAEELEAEVRSAMEAENA